MGSTFGPVLANIFVGYHEERLSIDSKESLLVYRRYVDDTFSIRITENESERFLGELNSLNPALKFTCESEENGSLPFLDTRLTKENGGEDAVSFSTAVYRKPTFTGQYTRWDSFSAKKHEANLIKCLTNRVVKISSSNKLQEELQEIRNIFEKNGYPPCVVEKVMARLLSPKRKKTDQNLAQYS